MSILPFADGSSSPIGPSLTHHPENPLWRWRSSHMGKEDKSTDYSSYSVGYGKPPKQSRFRKGLSGNPRGRPKGTLNLATVLTRELKEKVSVTQNGRRTELTKLEALMKQLINKAMMGDLQAVRRTLDLTLYVEQTTQDGSDGPEDVLSDERNRKVMEGVLESYARLRKTEGEHE